MKIKEANFGEVPGQGAAKLFTLTNEAGNSVRITNYGATLTSVLIDGAEMIVGFDELAGYLGDQPYYGALIGRYGNRITGASFSLNGQQHQLVANEGANQLHGGPQGFDKYIWEAKTRESEDATSLILSHTSPDGDMGFPGELTVTCTYMWDDENGLTIAYRAASSKDTIVNLTNHAYFTLGSATTIAHLTLRLAADAYTPLGEDGLVTGELAPVANTPFDFRKTKAVGDGLDSSHPQILSAGGYDHNFVIAEYDGSLREIATLTNPSTGRRLTCFTTEPGVQVFTSNFEEGQFKERGGKTLPTHGAICLETQHFPDSPNQPAFKTPLLKADGVYETTTVYRFA